MADVWVSTGRRFCEICKSWFGNNKISQDHHERGEKHKAMLAQKIRETMQAGRKKEIAEEKLNSTLARMNAAAAASMVSHGEGIVHGPSLPTTGLRMNIFDPRQHKDVGSMAREMATRREEGNLKRKGLSGSAAPGAPDLKVSKEDVVSAYRDLTKPSAAGPALPEAMAVNYIPASQERPAEIHWVRAKSDQGVYFFNIYDLSTRWDTPAHFYTEEEYDQKCKEFEESRAKNYYGLDDVQAVRSGKKDLEHYIKEKIAESGFDKQVAKNRKEMNYTETNYGKGTKAEKRRRWEERKRQEEEDAQKIKEEASDGNDEDEEIDGIPLPPDGSSSPESEHSAIDKIFMPPPPPPKYQIVKEEEPECIKNEPEEEPEKEEITTTSAAPYGTWVRIKKEEKSDIPFESPLTARYREEEEREKEDREYREKNEPKIEFEEKVAATMTKKVKGPIEFKKKSATRNIRKREE